MPVVFRYHGFRFFFFSNEGEPREPMHVHVRKDGAEARFRLRPEVRVADSKGLDARTLRALARIVEDRKTEIERAWNEHFG